MNLIATNDELAAACERFARHPFVAVDTEFLRETTFWPLLCVVQVASDDEAVAIDALAEGLDLAPLFALMADEKVVKGVSRRAPGRRDFLEAGGRGAQADVRHPGRRHGLRLWRSGLLQRIGSIRSAMSRSINPRALPTGRAARWRRRRSNMRVGDVTYLRDIYRALLGKARKSGRLSWLEDEMKILTSASTL